MARYNEILTGRHNNFLKKLFAMKGEAPAPQLSSDIQMVHPFFHGAENRYLENWQLFAMQVGSSPQAAQQGTVRIRNPATSNIVAVFMMISYIGAGADAPTLQIQQTNADESILAFPGNRLDGRIGITGGPNCVVSRSDAVTAAVALKSIYQKAVAAASTSVDFIVHEMAEIPLLPGDAMQLQTNVANTQFFTSWMWRERFLEDSERF